MSAVPYDEEKDMGKEEVAVVADFEEIPANQTVQRHLKSRHISFIGFGGGIGVGLFVGTGAALARAGPAGLLMAFVIEGFVLFGVIQSAAEMTTLFPKGGTSFNSFATRFFDPALGFALGWNYFLATALAISSELTACALLIAYWNDVLSPALWIGILLIPILALNLVGVKYYGESEVFTASLKVLTIVGLILFGLILDLGGVKGTERIGFRYWKNPGAFNEYPGVGGGAKAQFLAFFSAFINSAFSYSGTEVVVLTAGEATNPSKQIPKVARRVMYRIALFYCCGVLVIGMIVPYTEPLLLGGGPGSGLVRGSPWVIAINKAGVKALPSIINAIIITSAWSAGNTYCYIASRNLLSLAVEGQAPSVFKRVNKAGVPYAAVIATWAFGLLGFLSAGSGGAQTAFNWIQNLLALASQLSWASICLSFFWMYRAMKAQGIDRNTLPMKSPLQPYFAWFSIIMCTIITLFSGYGVFIEGNWDVQSFISNYINVALYVVLYAGYKIIKRSKMVNPAEADLWSGRLAPEDEEDEALSGSAIGRFLDKLL